MEKPKLVIVDAGDHWTRLLFSELARTYDVLLVKLATPRALRKGQGALLYKQEEAGEGVKLLTVQMPPRHLTTTWPLARWLITRAIRAAGYDAPDVLALSYPYYADLIDALGARQSLYYIYDEYSRFWPDHAEDVLAREAKLIARADHTITVSKFNTDRLRALHGDAAARIHHVPNGVSPTYMADQLPEQQVPETLAALPQPIAGYIGSLNFRFDFPLLAKVAEMRPDVSFVLGGWFQSPLPDDAEWMAGYSRAHDLPNVHFVGEVPYDQLIAHWQAFDVFLIPYAKCLFNDVACPLKLWDYLSQGGPIVANANNPETLLWANHLHIGATPQAFADGIDAALAEGKSRAAECIAVARDHTWDKMAAKVEDLLAEQRAGPR